jgi:hypothetical protein
MQYLQMNILQKLSTIDIAAETIYVLLDNDISRKIMFETIKENLEYKGQMTKILSEEDCQTL